ncbi:MAG: hypothetical protein K0Q59_3074 [Paenibacillus sp.]|jgi:L-ascorbate metabolism protein UlaG (beta-lactamase superfamily)|nr:hypothetical protein [Paenibacillus sp.]
MGKYENETPTSMSMNMKTVVGMLKEYMKSGTQRRPAAAAIPVVEFRATDEALRADAAQVTWFGHSAFLLELEGKRLLFDPMLGPRPSPVSWAGTKRYADKLPLPPERFPALDAIILSHDHYDHLDYASIRALKDKTRRFIVPLGVRERLIRWGVRADDITEHNWWDELELNGLKLACTPARHFSGRGMFNRNSTLWCSWVIAGRATKVFYSGDSGYGPHFKRIGETYGPFDLTLMECGQYNERWAAIHMMPEETVQAHLDVRGRLLLPVHWGAFTLALHAWNDPVERATKAARERQVDIVTPKIGQTVAIHAKLYPESDWWR